MVINKTRQETINSPNGVIPTITSEYFIPVTKKTTAQTPINKIYPVIPSRYNIKKNAK